MLQKFGAICARISQEVIPSPFVFAIILSAVVFILGPVFTDSTPLQMVEYWYGGFWNLLTFGMQVVATLLFGYVLASSPPFRSIIERISRVPRSAGHVLMLISVTAIIFGIVNWAVGLIVGAIGARELCLQARARGIRVHYPLAAAAGFSPLLLNAVFSASAPLLSNTEGHFLYDKIGLVPITETILAPYNIIVVLTFLIVIPLVIRSMMPQDKDIVEVPLENSDVTHSTGGQATSAEADQSLGGRLSIADRLERSWVVTALPVIAGVGYVIYHFATRGFDLNLNIVNFILLIAGLIAYKTPAAYVEAVELGIRACGQIVLQFPFYAGIMGMMSASGLVTVFAKWVIAVSTPYTFPLAALLSAGVVNMFVPSAGGQWAVQGPVLIEAAQALDVDIGLTIMAFTYGDQMTNGIQPMWMLPLLGVVALKAKQMLGYTAIMMLFAGIIFSLGVTVVPAIFS